MPNTSRIVSQTVVQLIAEDICIAVGLCCSDPRAMAEIEPLVWSYQCRAVIQASNVRGSFPPDCEDEAKIVLEACTNPGKPLVICDLPDKVVDPSVVFSSM